MKVALIPPKGLWHTAKQSDYHLCLAQIQDNDYYVNYGYLPDDHYIIMDNGAAEGGAVDNADLVAAANRMGADEVVVPDVIGDCNSTLKSIGRFFGEGRHLEVASTDKFMLVVQGKTEFELNRCVREIVGRYPNAVLGIPRHLLVTLNKRMARIDLLRFIENRYENREVHLLGTSAMWPREVAFIAKEFPWVRGIDSSMPYSYTIAGRRLDELGVVSRPDNYFDLIHNVDEELLQHNINVFKEWASGTEGTRS